MRAKKLKRRIRQLEREIAELWHFVGAEKVTLTDSGTVALPWVSTSAACDHIYPSPWLSTLPPRCSRCGQQASGTASWTCTVPIARVEQ